jgi:hypothetical protein
MTGFPLHFASKGEEWRVIKGQFCS